MSITLDSKLEAKLRERAGAEGLSLDAYVERLVRADQAPVEEIEELALEGLNSGEPIEPSPGYWEEKHRSLEARWKAKRA